MISVSLTFFAAEFAVVTQAFLPSQGSFAHLASTVLPDYVSTTALLLAGVAIGINAIGIFAAWFVSWFRFPGRGLLEWALILPLAMPAYVMAYAYTDFLQFSGPVQTALRELTGWKVREYWFPEVRSTGGAIIMFSFVLYPYVYLIARAAFREQSLSLLEAARLLGSGVWGVFLRVGLPLARPAIAAGTSLALMEVLADFGAVSYFSVNTFTTGIYRAWYSMGDSAAAAQLALILLGFVALLVFLERLNRSRARYDQSSPRPNRLHELCGWRAWLVVVLCAIPPLVGFFLPMGILGHVIWSEPAPLFTPRFFTLTGNSLSLALIAAGAAVMLATLMAYAARLAHSPAVTLANRVAGLGYAIPGAVIAVGILVPLGRLDNLLSTWLETAAGIQVGLLLTGTLFAVVAAARLPAAPAMFCTMTGCFQSAFRRCARRRAAMSAPPPGAKGAIMRTGLDGKSWAETGAAAVIRDRASPAAPSASQPRCCGDDFMLSSDADAAYFGALAMPAGYFPARGCPSRLMPVRVRFYTAE